MRMLLDRIAVEIIEAPEKTESGIFLPKIGEDGEMVKRAKVIEVGPGRTEKGKIVPLNVKKGDIIMFQKPIAVYIKVKGREYYIIRDSDVLVVL